MPGIDFITTSLSPIHKLLKRVDNNMAGQYFWVDCNFSFGLIFSCACGIFGTRKMSEQKKTDHYNVPFDDRHFKKLADEGVSLSIDETFKQIYHTNLWNGNDSASGNGSDLTQTREIAKHLPFLIKEFKIKTFLDLPCGDFNWLSRVELGIEQYIGGDIVAEIIQMNRQSYSDDTHRFMKLDITKDDLPEVDLIFCRDCLVHLSYEDIKRVFSNIKNSGITYILMTTFPDFSPNHDIISGDWRPLNLEIAPFNLPKPVRVINEKCREGGGVFADKSLGLWLCSSW
jgi:Methyltransferase domain